MLLSDISQASEKVLYIKKDGFIYFLYGQFPDKQGYWILNNLRRELGSSLGGQKFDQLSPVELHNLKLRFPTKINFVLEQYTKAATEIITDRQIPSVVDSIRFDYFGMSYQSIGTISKILGDDLLDLQPGEDTATADRYQRVRNYCKDRSNQCNYHCKYESNSEISNCKIRIPKVQISSFEKLTMIISSTC